MIGSPQQLAEVLFVKLGLSRKRRGKTGFSTDARVLQAIRDEHPIIPKIERFRELTKLVQTYLDALPAWIGDDGRLHTTFLQTNAATGRLASINPNLQNIPIRTETGRVIRQCFVAEPGNVLTSVDYEQVELRVLAHIADEQVLRDIFLRGEDVHTETASKVFELPPEQLDVGMRSKAKMVNYGIVYGLSAYGLADRLQIPQEEAQEFIDRYLERFPAVHQFMKDAVEQAEQHGYVSTLFGRRRQIPEIRARNWQTRKLGERLAVNSVIQGTAADIIKVAMVRAHRALADEGLKTRLILQIHDELLAEGPAGGGRAGRRGDLARDGRRRRPRPAAEGRRRLRPELARGEIVDKGVAVAVAAVVGGLVATQAPLNSQLGRVVGGVNASVVALAVSFVALLTLAALTDGLGGIRRSARRRSTSRSAGPRRRALRRQHRLHRPRPRRRRSHGVTIAGQLGVAMVIDHFGWLGVERSPITAAKIAGVALLAVGPGSSSWSRTELVGPAAACRGSRRRRLARRPPGT